MKPGDRVVVVCWKHIFRGVVVESKNAPEDHVSVRDLLSGRLQWVPTDALYSEAYPQWRNELQELYRKKAAEATDLLHDAAIIQDFLDSVDAEEREVREGLADLEEGRFVSMPADKVESFLTGGAMQEKESE